MVSQKFMDILHQQPHYSKPSTSNSSSTINSNVQNPFLKIKEENEDMMIKEEDMIIKEEEEDMTMIKKEKDDHDNWQAPASQIRKSDMNKPLDEVPKSNDKRNFASMHVSLPHPMKEKQVLRPPSKRIRKEKIIFDPSEVSSHTQRNQRNKISCKIKYDLPCISETNKSCIEMPKEDAVSKCTEDWDGDLTCKYCGKYMQRSDYLRLHLMKHTGETPHKCPYCKNGYRARWRLAQHLRTHTKNLPYHCPYCNYTGNRSDYLTSHMKRIHKGLVISNYEKVMKKRIANDKERK